jgi:hypothetical protein
MPPGSVSVVPTWRRILVVAPLAAAKPMWWRLLVDEDPGYFSIFHFAPVEKAESSPHRPHSTPRHEWLSNVSGGCNGTTQPFLVRFSAVPSRF